MDSIGVGSDRKTTSAYFLSGLSSDAKFVSEKGYLRL